MRPVEALGEALHLTFKDGTLLKQALVHRSYLNENPDSSLSSNERLEFLGDAILDFLVGELAFRHFPELDEGGLTRLRAALVQEATLARLARSLGLGHHLYLSRGEEESGGRERPAILCAAFEALIGALYLDGGLRRARPFVKRMFAPEVRKIRLTGLKPDAKSALQELTQEVLRLTPTYRLVSANGPDHAREFTVQVLIGGETWGQGQGPTKQIAEREAARLTLTRLREVGIFQEKEDV